MKNPNGFCHIPLQLQVAEVQVTYRNKIPYAERQKVNGSVEAEKIYRMNWGADMKLVEEFNVLFLNRANYVKGLSD